MRSLNILEKPTEIAAAKAITTRATWIFDNVSKTYSFMVVAVIDHMTTKSKIFWFTLDYLTFLTFSDISSQVRWEITWINLNNTSCK